MVLLTIVAQTVIVELEVDLQRKDSQYEIYFDPSLKTFDWHHLEQVLNMFKTPQFSRFSNIPINWKSAESQPEVNSRCIKK